MSDTPATDLLRQQARAHREQEEAAQHASGTRQERLSRCHRAIEELGASVYAMGCALDPFGPQAQATELEAHRQKVTPLLAAALTVLREADLLSRLEQLDAPATLAHYRKQHDDPQATELAFAYALAERAKSGAPADKRDLLEVYGLFASEYDYRPVDGKTLPYWEFVSTECRRWTKRLLHSYGAMQCLEKLLDLVDEKGFILINDYGTTDMRMEDDFEHQRFSLATFVGINFAQLRAYFGEGQRAKWLEPFGGEEGIHSRLLSRQPLQETVGRFQECFGQAAQQRRQEPLIKARLHAQMGRFEMAADFYRQAVAKQSHNWVLLNEAAMFLIFSLRDLKAGIDLAKVGLAQNPTCSSELWNTLGDGLFEHGRIPEARSAYEKALAINPADVRARYNLVWVHQREKNYPAALAMAAEALTQDKMGQYRDRILQKQAEVLAGLRNGTGQEYLLLVNLVSKYAEKSDKDKPKADTADTPRTEPQR